MYPFVQDRERTLDDGDRRGDVADLGPLHARDDFDVYDAIVVAFAGPQDPDGTPACR